MAEIAEEEQELEALVAILSRYKMMTNSANGIQRKTKVKGHSSTMEQLFQMMAPNQRFSQGLSKPLQLLQK